MNNKVYFKGISIDLTRKCNMNCKHCFRGDAENNDITKEIIDKLLDEVQDCYISQINLTGGEPCLNPDMVLYLAEQLIARNIKVTRVSMPSNGTIKSDTVKQAFSLLAQYFQRNRGKSWYNDICRHNNHNIEKNVVLVLSQDEHEEIDLSDTMKFYRIPYHNFKVYLESEAYDNKQELFITGRLEKEYQNYSKEEQKNMIALRKDERFCLINDSEGGIVSVEKTVSISTDGSIYAGLICSWDDMKHKSIGNILDCNNDLIELLDSHSWKYPINKDAYTLRELYYAILWHREHDVALTSIDNQAQETIIRYQPLIDLYEQTLKDFHKNYPALNHKDVKALVVAVMALSFMQKGHTQELFFVLTQFGELSDEEAVSIKVSELKNSINSLTVKGKEKLSA